MVGLEQATGPFGCDSLIVVIFFKVRLIYLKRAVLQSDALPVRLLLGGIFVFAGI